MASPQIENGYSRIANEIFDEIAKLKLNGTQFRILIVLWRQTYGFSRKEHELSEGFIAKATGVHKHQINREILNLIERKIITVTKAPTYTKPRQLSFNKNYDEWKLKSGQPSKTLTVNETMDKCDSENVDTTASENVDQRKKSFKTKNKYIYTDVFDFYNSLELVRMKKYSEKIEKAIESAVKDVGSVEKLKELMQRHKVAVEKTRHKGQYSVKSRNIQDFLTRKIDRLSTSPFVYEEYLEHGSKYQAYIAEQAQPEPRKVADF